MFVQILQDVFYFVVYGPSFWTKRKAFKKNRLREVLSASICCIAITTLFSVSMKLCENNNYYYTNNSCRHQ